MASFARTPIFRRRERCSVTCVRCGQPLIAPESSQHVDEHCILHGWLCDACGHRFENLTMIDFARHQVRGFIPFLRH